MSLGLVLVLCISQVAVVITKPLQLLIPQEQFDLQPLKLQPQLQMSVQPLQQQMQALQLLQALQAPIRFNWLQPSFVMLPQSHQPTEILHAKYLFRNRNEFETENEQELIKTKIQDNNDEDDDSIAINAEPIETEKQAITNTNIRRVIIQDPNTGRYFIGYVIGLIPFLPFEVNVPDTISSIWNGLSGIIGGIGQNFPFRPNRPQLIQTAVPITAQEDIAETTQETVPSEQPAMLKLLMNRWQPKRTTAQSLPMLVMPLNMPQ